jgi:hypothetical protein
MLYMGSGKQRSFDAYKVLQQRLFDVLWNNETGEGGNGPAEISSVHA